MSNKDVWKCKKCGWIIADLARSLLRADVGCARCGNSLLDFELLEDFFNRKKEKNKT